MSWTKNILLGGFAALISISVPAFSAQVQRSTYDRELIARLPSTEDEIGIAFLKTANNFPDFGKVAEMSNKYQRLDMLAQKDFKEKEVSKLQNAYLAFEPKKTDLVVRAKVNVMFRKLPNGESILKLNTFTQDPVYFPFYFAKYPIAMIVKDMEMFRELHLTQEETETVYLNLSLSGEATLLLQLYAIAADDEKTVTLDNIPQYPLLTEIGYIGLINREGEQIWAWKNPNYEERKINGGRVLLNPNPQSTEGQ